MSYQHILFDLDGTLVQSEVGIFNSIAYAYEKMQKSCPNQEVLRAFIGPPLGYGFEHLGGLKAEETEQAITLYREYYTEKGVLECTPYSGMEKLLQKLCAAEKHLYVATSKPEVFAVLILEHFGLSTYFKQIAGIEIGGAVQEKKDVIKRVLTENKLPLQACVMVGDRLFDIEGALACGIDSVGVLYGYGQREELQRAGVTQMVESVQSLGERLLG